MKTFGKKLACALIIVLILGLGSFLLFSSALRPALFDISEATLRAMALKSMNTAVSGVLAGETAKELVNVTHSDKMSMIQSDAVKMNQIAMEVSLAAQDNINSLGEGIAIPIGTVVGGPVFTGRGFDVVVGVEPIGAVEARFESEFTTAGINQTRHRIYLTLTATIELVAGGASQEVVVDNEVLISESIIIGDVPDTFLESSRDELMNLVG